MSNLAYIIKATADVTSELYDASVFTPENVRKSHDGTKVILKFEGDTGALLDNETVYTSMSELMEAATPGDWQ